MRNKAKINKLKTIDDLYVFTKTGTVLGNQNWTETNVHTTTTTTGGGGNAYYYNAPSTSTSVSTSSSEQLRLFIHQDDGSEFDVQFSELGFGVREGHRVSVVYGGDKVSERGWAMGLVNHSINRDKLFDKNCDWLINRLSGNQTTFTALGILGLFILGTVLSKTAFGGLFTFGAWTWIAYLLYRRFTNDKLKKAVVAEIDKAMDKSVEDEKARKPAATPEA